MIDIESLVNCERRLKLHLNMFKGYVEALTKYDFDKCDLIYGHYEKTSKSFKDILEGLDLEHYSIIDCMRTKKTLDELRDVIKNEN